MKGGSGLAVQLKDLPYIKFRAELTHNVYLEKTDFQNFFRIYKKQEEILSDDSFCCIYFGNKHIFQMKEDFLDRKEAMELIYAAMKDTPYLSIYFKYDFRFAAVNDEYYTEGEFQFVKDLIEKALEGTNFYLCFMVSHFAQLVGKPLRVKDEHYHIIIGKYNDMGEEEYNKAIEKLTSYLEEHDTSVYNDMVDDEEIY